MPANPRAHGGRVLGALLLAIAALATAAPARVHPARPAGASAAAPAPFQADETVDPPADLGGAWSSVANGDRIVDLLRDDEAGGVWTAGDGGLVHWPLSGGAYRQYLAPQDGLPSNQIRAIARDPVGHLWLGTARGLARFDPESETVVERLDPDVSPGMPGWSVTALASADDGLSLWVGFEQQWDPTAPHPEPDHPDGAFVGGGLARLDLETRTWSDRTTAERETLPPGDDSEPDFLSIPSANITALALGSDGALWVGSRPYFEWQRACPDGACSSGWILSGGGLAARTEGPWRRWRASLDPRTSCYGNTVTAVTPDVSGRVWVGTAGDGMLLMSGPDQPASCASGQAYYLERRLSGETVLREGLRGRFVWSIDVDPAGRVWIGNGDRQDRGRGIVILDHKGTFHDSSASLTPWASDDVWTFLDVGGGGDGDPSRALVSRIDVASDAGGLHLIGTVDGAPGDGHGLHVLDAASEWRALRTADNGLPSNRITDVAVDESGGSVWFATAERGVARWDVADGRWSAWTAFEPAGEATSVSAATAAGFARVPVSLAGEEAFREAFPGSSRWATIGDSAVLHTVTGFIPRRGSLGPFLELSPPLAAPAPAGTVVRRIERGPPSDRATRIAVDSAGAAWVGAQKKTWQADAGGGCPTYPDCWLDGGVGRYTPDGGWTVFDPANSDLLDRDIAAVAHDTAGRAWMAQSDLSASGHGLAAYDPSADTWALHGVSVDLTAGNGAADVDVDPLSGTVWTAHFPVEGIARLPDGSPVHVFYGGGVARWDGVRWQSFDKRQPGSTMRAQGDHGTFFRILVDRAGGRVWAGGWDARGGPETFHWPTGRGVNAVVNWCSIDACVPSAWAHRAWAEEGQVGALAIDRAARVWVGVHRRGLGIVPGAGGIKLHDAGTWRRIDVESSNGGLPSNEITALEPAADGMWAGTLRSGAAFWRGGPTGEPSATPPPSSPDPSPSATDSPTPIAGTPSPEQPSPTPTPRPTSDEPTPTPWPSATPHGACGPGDRCAIHLPFAWRPRR